MGRMDDVLAALGRGGADDSEGVVYADLADALEEAPVATAGGVEVDVASASAEALRRLGARYDAAGNRAAGAGARILARIRDEDPGVDLAALLGAAEAALEEAGYALAVLRPAWPDEAPEGERQARRMLRAAHRVWRRRALRELADDAPAVARVVDASGRLRVKGLTAAEMVAAARVFLAETRD